MEENENGFAEFAEAFSGGDGNQTVAAEETEPADNGSDQEPTGDGGEPESGQQQSIGEPIESEKDGGGDEKPAESQDQRFKIKVNKQEREVGYDEMVSLAQKGADYDRVKDQLAESRQEIQNLKLQADEHKDLRDVLEFISKESNVPMDQLADQFYINFRKGSGSTEAEAKAELRAFRAERQIDALKAQGEQKQKADEAAAVKDRAKTEIAEFRAQYPGIELTQELCDKLMPDVQSGMTLTNAYRKLENARKDEEISQLKRQLEAEKKNSKNRANSPGSQKDAGGKTAKSDFDEFAEAFR